MAEVVLDDTIVRAFMNLFRGRVDAWGSVEGRSNKEKVTKKHYERHLKGEISLGVYMLQDDSSCWFFTVDFDEPDTRKALRIRQEFRDNGIPVYLAASKSKGYHIYGFADKEPFQAKDIRRLANGILERLNLECEVFPKQDSLDGMTPFGNYVNLPCFGHTRQFIKGDLKAVPLAEAVKQIQRIPKSKIEEFLKSLPPPVIPTVMKVKGGAKKGKHPPCIEAIMKGVAQPGRDLAAFALARHFLDQNYTEAEVLGLLQTWDANNRPPINDVHLLQTKVRSAAKGYSFGCSSITSDAYLKGFCVGEDTCIWLKIITQEKMKKGLIREMSFCETETHIYEEIVVQGSKPCFLAYEKSTGGISYVGSLDYPDFRIVPIQSAEITEGAVTLPTGIEEYGSAVVLVEEVKALIKTYVDLPDVALEFSTWYIMMSWVYDRLNTISYLRFQGDTGCGKSRALDVIGRLCYKPLMMAGAVTPAPIYREIRRFRGTVILEEADFSDTSEKSEVITILNCLAPGTKVISNPKAKDIEQIAIGDLVLGHNGRFLPVTRVFERDYIGNLVEITPGYSNVPIKISPEHIVLTKDGWVEAGDINLKDRLAIPKPRVDEQDIEELNFKVKVPFREKGKQSERGRWCQKQSALLNIPFSEEIAWVLGLYIAEGCPHSENYIVYTVNKDELEIIQRVVSIFERYFNYRPSLSYQGNTCHINICINGLGQAFAALFGDKARNKSIPKEFLYLPTAKIRALLRGIFDGDGHQQPEQGHMQGSTSSEGLVYQIRFLLGSRLNILPGIYNKGLGDKIIQGRKVKTTTRWHIRVSAYDMPKLGYNVPTTLMPRTRHLQEDDNYWYVLIHKITLTPYTGKLFNLAVEEDESYSLLNLHCHNCGFERNRPVIRCSRDNPDNLEILPCFGPKVFATRFRFSDIALEARCLTFIMEETDRDDIPPLLGSKFHVKEELLRKKLLLWRLRNYQGIDPDAVEGIELGRLEPRLKQIGLPFCIPFKDQPDVLERFKQFLHAYGDEIIEERYSSLNGQVLCALFKMADLHGKDMVSSTLISDCLQEDFKVEKSSVSVGKTLKSLHITRSNRRVAGTRARYLNWDNKLMVKLMRRYLPKEIIKDYESLLEEAKIDMEV